MTELVYIHTTKNHIFENQVITWQNTIEIVLTKNSKIQYDPNFLSTYTNITKWVKKVLYFPCFKVDSYRTVKGMLKFSIGNIVKNTIITMYGVSRYQFYQVDHFVSYINV